MIKVVKWHNESDDDWYYDYEYLDKIKTTPKELNKRIEADKKADPNNVKHGGYCYNEGCFVEAFYDTPIITDTIYLELLAALSDVKSLKIEHCTTDELRSAIISNCIALDKNVVDKIFAGCNYQHQRA